MTYTAPFAYAMKSLAPDPYAPVVVRTSAPSPAPPRARPARGRLVTTTEPGLRVERRQAPRAIRPDRLTVWPSEDGYSLDVRWHGRECILRAVVVRRLLVEAGLRGPARELPGRAHLGAARGPDPRGRGRKGDRHLRLVAGRLCRWG